MFHRKLIVNVHQHNTTQMSKIYLIQYKAKTQAHSIRSHGTKLTNNSNSFITNYVSFSIFKKL